MTGKVRVTSIMLHYCKNPVVSVTWNIFHWLIPYFTMSNFRHFKTRYSNYRKFMNSWGFYKAWSSSANPHANFWNWLHFILWQSPKGNRVVTHWALMLRWTRDSRKQTLMDGPFARERRGSGPEKQQPKHNPCRPVGSNWNSSIQICVSIWIEFVLHMHSSTDIGCRFIHLCHHKSWPQNMCHTHSWPQQFEGGWR